MNPSDDTPVADLRNLGPVSRQMLAEIDVRTAGHIRQLGPDLIYHILKGKGTNVSMNLVYALQAAVQNRHWLDLTTTEKDELRKACIDPSS